MSKLFNILFLIAIFCSLAFSVASAETKTAKSIPNSFSATITWVTDKPSTSEIEYGKDSAYGKQIAEDINLVTYHKVNIYNLTPSTLYHYRVRSKDAFGNEAVSPDFTFITLREPAKDQPPQISDIEAEAIVAAGPGPQAPVKKEAKTQEEELAGEEAGQLVKKEEPIEKALIERGGLLLPKGKWQVEPAFTYAHISKNRIAITGFTILPILIVGEISSEEVKRDLLIQTLTFRYGLRDDLQTELKIPLRYQYNRITTAGVDEVTSSDGGLGDIECSIFHHFLRESGGRPDLIAGLTVKSKTGKEPYGRDIGLGTGHWGIKGSLVWVKSSDPAILFGNLGYTYSFPERYSDFGKVKPGGTIQYGLGLAFALNYQVALNFQLEQLITAKMEMDRATVADSFLNVINFKSGLTWAISKNLSLDLNVSLGLTEDSPDAVIEVRLPYTF